MNTSVLLARAAGVKDTPVQVDDKSDLAHLAWLHHSWTGIFLRYLENLASKKLVEAEKYAATNKQENDLWMRQSLREKILIERILDYARRGDSNSPDA